jgi:hypothetical protein
MISEAMMGASALKTAFDMAKALKDIDDRTRRNDAVIELQEKILGAQTAQAALIQEVGELEKEVTALKAWEADKKRYELKDLGIGAFTLMSRSRAWKMANPPHGICTNCYQKGFKSILQSSGHPVVHDRSWDCHGCDSKIKNQSNDMGFLITKCRLPTSTA